MDDFVVKMRHKFKAASIHFGLSVVVFLTLLYFILFEWYPEPFFTIDGGVYGIKLIAGIDLILGPCITFIVYNYTKSIKEIIFDLSMIAAIQISALVWGILQVYDERPVAVVFWEDSFYTVTSDYYEQQGIDLGELEKFSQHAPPVIIAKKPSGVVELEAMLDLLNKGIPPYAQYQLYHDYKDDVDELSSKTIPNEMLSESARSKIRQYEASNAIENIYAIQIIAKYGKAVLLMDELGHIVDTMQDTY